MVGRHDVVDELGRRHRRPVLHHGGRRVRAVSCRHQRAPVQPCRVHTPPRACARRGSSSRARGARARGRAGRAFTSSPRVDVLVDGASSALLSCERDSGPRSRSRGQGRGAICRMPSTFAGDRRSCGARSAEALRMAMSAMNPPIVAVDDADGERAEHDRGDLGDICGVHVTGGRRRRGGAGSPCGRTGSPNRRGPRAAPTARLPSPRPHPPRGDRGDDCADADGAAQLGHESPAPAADVEPQLDHDEWHRRRRLRPTNPDRRAAVATMARIAMAVSSTAATWVARRAAGEPQRSRLRSTRASLSGVRTKNVRNAVDSQGYRQRPRARRAGRAGPARG